MRFQSTEGRLSAPQVLSSFILSSTWAWVRWRASSHWVWPVAVKVRDRAVAPVGVFAEFGLLPGRSGNPAGDDPHVGRPAGEFVAVRAVAQDRGEVCDRRALIGCRVGSERVGPVGLAQLVDPGLGAFIDRPADGVLDPPAPPAPPAVHGRRCSTW